MKLNITILGCGPSAGVPSVMVDPTDGCIKENWGRCDPDNPKNRRSRMSVLLTYNGKNVLIDTSPDLRYQLLREEIKINSGSSSGIDAVLFTHDHADHAHGIDELRPLYFSLPEKQRSAFDIYSDAKTIEGIKQSFPYLFADHMRYSESDRPSLYPELMHPHIIEYYKSFELFGANIMPIEQDHGYTTSVGYRIGDFAYSTDVKAFDDRAMQALKGVKLWLVDCICEKPTPTHSHLEQTIGWVKEINPERAVLIHMKNTLDYEKLKKQLPPNIEPAYDGMKLSMEI